jgi:hypothetical protein
MAVRTIREDGAESKSNGRIYFGAQCQLISDPLSVTISYLFRRDVEISAEQRMGERADRRPSKEFESLRETLSNLIAGLVNRQRLHKAILSTIGSIIQLPDREILNTSMRSKTAQKLKRLWPFVQSERDISRRQSTPPVEMALECRLPSSRCLRKQRLSKWKSARISEASGPERLSQRRLVALCGGLGPPRHSIEEGIRRNGFVNSA